MIEAVLAFAGVAALINITPGLDTLLVLRASAEQISGVAFLGFSVNLVAEHRG